MLKTLHPRLQQYMNHELPDVQAGFRKGRGTRNQNTNIHCIIKKARSAAAAAKTLQSCLTLCNPIDSCPPGFPVPVILQARILEWVAISFSNAWKWKVKVKSLSRVRPHGLQPTRLLRRGIFQARILEWAAIAFSSLQPLPYQNVLNLAWKHGVQNRLF